MYVADLAEMNRKIRRLLKTCLHTESVHEDGMVVCARCGKRFTRGEYDRYIRNLVRRAEDEMKRLQARLEEIEKARRQHLRKLLEEGGRMTGSEFTAWFKDWKAEDRRMEREKGKIERRKAFLERAVLK